MASTKNEGEGNRTADRQYRQGVKDHVEHHDMQGDADRARKVVDSPEGKDLRKAEEEGKSHSKGEDPNLYKKGG